MKPNVKIIIGMLIFIIIISSSSAFLYKNVITVAETESKNTVLEVKEQQFKLIWGCLEHLITQAEATSLQVASGVENDLIELPRDELLKLRNDMSNNQFNEVLHDILSENISNINLNGIDNHRNGVVIMTATGYIEDNNYRRAHLEQTSDDYNYPLLRSWQTSISNSYNKGLDTDAMDKILNRTSGIIALESYDLTKNEEHIKINEFTYENLLSVYLNEGLNGLRNYQIFVVSYITDNGDIFGSEDICAGIKTNTNKIIIAQEFNLYDQIMIKNNTGIFTDDTVDNIINSHKNLLRWLYTFGFVLIVTVCGLIIYFCRVYNSLIDEGENNNTETPEKNTI